MAVHEPTFKAILRDGIYCEFAQKPGTRAGRRQQWEVYDSSGKLLGSGASQSAAIDKAYKAWQRRNR